MFGGHSYSKCLWLDKIILPGGKVQYGGFASNEKTGVPILSLYENDTTHAPSAQSMASFDTLVVDMQDVGLRYYTYYIALYYLMDACAKNQKAVVILDRPNPNGFYVDGEILKDEYASNVGRLPIPTVYGMTWGELARMINGEGWLTAGKNSCRPVFLRTRLSQWGAARIFRLKPTEVLISHLLRVRIFLLCRSLCRVRQIRHFWEKSAGVLIYAQSRSTKSG